MSLKDVFTMDPLLVEAVLERLPDPPVGLAYRREEIESALWDCKRRSDQGGGLAAERHNMGQEARAFRDIDVAAFDVWVSRYPIVGGYAG